MGAYVYIDGLGLYYGSVRGTPFKWLNFALFADTLVPNEAVEAVRYFVPLDPNEEGRARQQALLDANAASSQRLTIHHVAADDPVAELSRGLLSDARAKRCGRAVIVSNDVRVAPAMLEAWQRYRVPCGVAAPLQAKLHPTVREAAVFIKHVRRAALNASQLADPVEGENGPISKPADW